MTENLIAHNRAQTICIAPFFELLIVRICKLVFTWPRQLSVVVLIGDIKKSIWRLLSTTVMDSLPLFYLKQAEVAIDGYAWSLVGNIIGVESLSGQSDCNLGL